MPGLVEHKKALWELRREAVLRKLTRDERRLLFSYSAYSETKLMTKYSKMLIDYFLHIKRCFDVLDAEGRKELVAELTRLDVNLGCDEGQTSRKAV